MTEHPTSTESIAAIDAIDAIVAPLTALDEMPVTTTVAWAKIMETRRFGSDCLSLAGAVTLTGALFSLHSHAITEGMSVVSDGMRS